MGYSGCAVAFNITYTLSFFFLIFIGKFSPDPELKSSIVPLSKRSFHNLNGFARISANGMFIIMLEYWCNDII
jgi:Na+-driven multidrug efflux pump